MISMRQSVTPGTSTSLNITDNLTLSSVEEYRTNENARKFQDEVLLVRILLSCA
jgi:hypothetical protein